MSVNLIKTGKIFYSDIFPLINLKTLFRTRWGFGKNNLSDSEFNELLQKNAYPVFNELIKLFKPILTFNYTFAFFDSFVEQDSVLVNYENVTETFTFPRQKSGEKICLVDFLPKEKFPLFVVSIEKKVFAELEKFKNCCNYQYYFFLNGLCAELTDIAAEFVMRKMFEQYLADNNLNGNELKVCRYSFGYPACPDIEYQRKLFLLLKPENIGVTLTESCLMEPEFSVSAIVGIKNNARYFNI